MRIATSTTRRGPLAGLAAMAVATAGLVVTTTSAAAADEHHEEALPIVFVHGAFGSASQYQTQALRWASNDYPNVVTAIDRTTSDSDELNPMLDEFFDDVMAESGDDQVYVVGHSLGVALMNDYLDSSPERTARVAKYIGIDSGSAGDVVACPGTPEPVPCMGIYRQDNSDLALGEHNVYLPGGHVEVASSAESFAHQHEFFTGDPPATTLVLPEPPGQVEVAGRAVNFPANTGPDGATLEIWQVDSSTGARQARKARITLDESGDWGPVKLNGNHHHEFELRRTDSDLTGHTYMQPFIRDDSLVRLLTASPGSPSLEFTNASDNHGAAVVLRNKEWWSDHPSGQNDILEVTTTSAGRGTEAAGDILTAAVGNGSVGLHIHDAAATPGDSTLDLLPVFPLFPFQTGVDVFMPATDPPDGTITFANAPRGDTGNLQVLNTANWPSDDHRMIVQFNDYAQGIDSWPDCKRAKPSPC